MKEYASPQILDNFVDGLRRLDGVQNTIGNNESYVHSFLQMFDFTLPR